MTSSREKKILVGLGFASLVIAGVTVVYYVGSSHLADSADRVGDSHALIASLGDFERALQDVRMSTRGYVITGDEEVLAMNVAAREDVKAAMAALRQGCARENRRQEYNLLRQLARERLDDSDRLIHLREKAGGLVAGIATGMTYRRDLHDPLHQLVEDMTVRTRAELERRTALADSGRVVMLVMLIVGAALELAFAAAAAGVVRRELAARRRAVETVEKNERTLRSFYDSDVTMMGVVELVGDDILHVSANGATARLFGSTPEAVVGRRTSQLGTPPDVLSRWVEHYREALARAGRVEFEYEHRTADGRRCWLSAVACAIPRATPEVPQQFSYVALDVTARKAAEAALRRQSAALEQARRAADAASEAKSNFLANMSHEIRTPMTAVVGYSELLAEPGRSDQERVEWAGVIRRNAHHLLDLINDILDLSKIEAGRLTLESLPIAPAALTADVMTLLRPRAAQKGVVLRLDAAQSLLSQQVLGDPARLRQVLVNLIGNAIKFTPAGEVTVRLVWHEARGLELFVRDTGIGMTPQHLARLFRPFTQGDETMTRRFGGTGLGLTITKRLIEAMGGTIDVHSESGVGTEFRIRLPLKAAVTQPPPLAVSPSVAAAKPRGPMAAPPKLTARVLLAEDSADTQRLLSWLLSRAGAEVVTVNTGRAAVERAAAERFDLILMDMQMPVMDGYAAAAELRRQGVAIPIIALTAHAMTGDRERCLAAGCTDYLTKPLDRGALLARLTAHLATAADAAPKAA